MGPSDTIRSTPLPAVEIGSPSLLHVYTIDIGFAFAFIPTCSDSPSIPTTVDDGGGTNFGASVLMTDSKKKKKKSFPFFFEF